MANLPEFVVAYLACVQVGAVAAPLNIRLKKPELEPLLQRLRPSLYIGQVALYSQIASVDESILAANRRFVVDGPVNDRRAQPWFHLLDYINGAQVRRPIDTNAPASIPDSAAYRLALSYGSGQRRTRALAAPGSSGRNQKKGNHWLSADAKASIASCKG
jgi:acyl-CoA synthetase (AMP-forming)/AMP-acid ligase II